MQANVKFSQTTIDGDNITVIIVALSGALDETNADNTFQQVNEYVDEKGANNIIFDLKELEYMNSKSIGYIIEFYRNITDKDGSIILARASESVLDILDLVGVTRVVQHAFTLDEAKLAILDAIKD